MPSFKNESLKDMHALLQQLDALNAAHAPEHLEWVPDLGITDALKSAGKTVSDAYNKNVKGQDLDKEAIWANLTDPKDRITVFKNTFKDIITDMQEKKEKEAWTMAHFDALKNSIHGNAKTKLLLQANMVVNPQPK